MNTAKEFSETGSGEWKEEIFTISDAIMSNNGPRASNIALINDDNIDNIFHLIEVERLSTK